MGCCHVQSVGAEGLGQPTLTAANCRLTNQDTQCYQVYTLLSVSVGSVPPLAKLEVPHKLGEVLQGSVVTVPEIWSDYATIPDYSNLRKLSWEFEFEFGRIFHRTFQEIFRFLISSQSKICGGL